jgi:hypothetical protein
VENVGAVVVDRLTVGPGPVKCISGDMVATIDDQHSLIELTGQAFGQGGAGEPCSNHQPVVLHQDFIVRTRCCLDLVLPIPEGPGTPIVAALGWACLGPNGHPPSRNLPHGWWGNR